MAPTVVADLHRLGGWTVARCPFCTCPHYHGGASLGARLSHCQDFRVRQQYVLERPASRRRATTKKEK